MGRRIFVKDQSMLRRWRDLSIRLYYHHSENDSRQQYGSSNRLRWYSFKFYVRKSCILGCKQTYELNLTGVSHTELRGKTCESILYFVGRGLACIARINVINSSERRVQELDLTRCSIAAFQTPAFRAIFANGNCVDAMLFRAPRHCIVLISRPSLFMS